nr:MAG TPA: hypothetical protein [Picobirnaviridae sp.]
MTHNQINFLAHQENVEHNRRSEALTERGQDLSLKATAISAAASRYAADRHYAATVYSADSAAAASRYQADTVAGWQGDKTTQQYVQSGLQAASWAIPFALGYGAQRKRTEKHDSKGDKPSGGVRSTVASAAPPVSANQQIPGQVEIPGWSAFELSPGGALSGAAVSFGLNLPSLDSVASYFKGVEQAFSQVTPRAGAGTAALGGFAAMSRFIPLFG